VVAGDRVVVLEAMKMEIAVVASGDGVVGEVFCEAGQSVVAGQVLMSLRSDGVRIIENCP
jgi:biotin carboxyl carrier protein